VQTPKRGRKGRIRRRRNLFKEVCWEKKNEIGCKGEKRRVFKFVRHQEANDGGGEENSTIREKGKDWSGGENDLTLKKS